MSLTPNQYEVRVNKVQRCIQGLNLQPTGITRKEAARSGKEYLDWVLEDSRFQFKFKNSQTFDLDLINQEFEVAKEVWKDTLKELKEIIERDTLEAARTKAYQMKRDLDKFTEGKLKEEERGKILEEFRNLLETINEEEVEYSLPDGINPEKFKKSVPNDEELTFSIDDKMPEEG